MVRVVSLVCQILPIAGLNIRSIQLKQQHKERQRTCWQIGLKTKAYSEIQESHDFVKCVSEPLYGEDWSCEINPVFALNCDIVKNGRTAFTTINACKNRVSGNGSVRHEDNLPKKMIALIKTGLYRGGMSWSDSRRTSSSRENWKRLTIGMSSCTSLLVVQEKHSHERSSVHQWKSIHHKVLYCLRVVYNAS